MDNGAAVEIEGLRSNPGQWSEADPGKNPKPAWWPPADVKIQGKAPVPYGDPQNPLGDWWISLEHDLHHGIGIHGTNDPGSMGTKASNGCIRMLNEEVVEVAALAYKGMVVSIVE